jgi:hypothetical protein
MSEAFPVPMTDDATVTNAQRYPFITSADWLVIDKMRAIIGTAAVDAMLRSGETEVRTRLRAFLDYENAFMRHVLASVPAPAAVPPPPSPRSSSAKPLKVSVKPFHGHQGENLAFWIREVDLALAAALVTLESQKVAFAMSYLQGAAREWALTWETNHPGIFATWFTLQERMNAMFLPPNAAFRHRAAFLACSQAKRPLYTFVQELRKLRASMSDCPLPESVMVTVFMQGLEYGPVKTEVFRQQPEELEVAINIALREDHLHRQAQGLPTGPLDAQVTPNGGAEPMDLSALEHIQCYRCGRFGHFQSACPGTQGGTAQRGGRGRGRGRRGRGGRGGRTGVGDQVAVNAVDHDAGNEISQ